MMDYCNGVEGFINYTLSNPRNISGDGIRCPCKRCKNKTFFNPNIVTVPLLQNMFMEKYLCWFALREPYVPYETVVERMVGSTSSFSNVHGVIDDNNNSYRSIVMDTMKMHQGYAGECSIIYEEQNTSMARFFDLLKDSNKILWDGNTYHSKLSVVV
jgi:hypothetical protein